MPTELAVPFYIAADGSIGSVQDPDVQIGQHVEMLVGTEPGERVMLPTYGVPTASQLFASDNDAVATLLSSKVETALETFEPGVFVQGVTRVTTNNVTGEAQIKVNFTRRESASAASSLSRNVNTAVVHVGGRVSEQVIG